MRGGSRLLATTHNQSSNMKACRMVRRVKERESFGLVGAKRKVGPSEDSLRKAKENCGLLERQVSSSFAVYCAHRSIVAKAVCVKAGRRSGSRWKSFHHLKGLVSHKRERKMYR